MDIFLISGFVIIIGIVLIYLFTLFIMYCRKNPTSTNVTTSNNKSIVTHSYVGKRGDMGNQIFQIATVIAAAERSGADIVFPPRLSSLPIYELFDLSQYPLKDVIPDASFYEYDNYEKIIIPRDGRIYNINGYRQAYDYFDDYSSKIRTVFTPKNTILDPVRNILPDQYIALHIRKGDYIKLIHKIPLLREFRRCQLDYYKHGIKLLRKYYPDCPLLVCTDSPKWVTPLLSELDSNCRLSPTIDNISPKFSDFCVLYLANAVVISNSTFSWMASYLNPHRHIVCPTPWWDPDGFIGSSMGLDGPYLHYPDWWLLSADDGTLIREPHSQIGHKPDTNHHTLSIFKLARSLLL